MLIVRIDGGWYADSTFAEKDALKAARWRWHPGPEPGKKRAAPAGVPDRKWWTDDPLRAAKLIDHTTGEVRAELERVVAEHEAALAASRAVDADVEIPCPDGLAYLPFQRAGIAYAAQRPGVLLADDMGLGKSIQTVGVLNLDASLSRVLVICPASLRINWQRELEKWLVRSNEVVIGPSKQTAEHFDSLFAGIAAVRVLIVNYDVLPGWEQCLRSVQLDALIVDEAHYLKSSRTRRSCHVYGGTPEGAERRIEPIRARRQIYLTGTPICNRPRELFPLIHALDAETWPNFFTFGKRYCNGQQITVGKKSFWDFSGATNLDELQERLRSTIMVRRLKSEVLTELPPKTRQVIELPENGAAGAVADEQAWWASSRAHIEQLAVAVELAKAADDPATYQAALDAMGEATKVAFTEMARVRRETARAKVPYVIEHVAALLEQTNKVVVFGHHKDVIGAIANHFGAEAVTLTGDTALIYRQAAVDRFQTDPTCRVFVGGIMAAGVGLTLTAASTVVFAELDWVPGNVTQSEDRLHRIGQRTNVLVQHLVLAGSMDAALAKAIVDKQQIADAALDTERDGALLTAPVPPLAPREQPATRTAKQREIAALAVHVPADVCALIHSLVRQLAGMCDGARLEDGHGFNKIDTSLGHALAELPCLTPKQAVLASRLVTFYRRQLPAEAVEHVGAAIAAAKAAATRQEAA